MDSRRRRRVANGGFTLIEIIVVIVIIGVLVTLIVPRLFSRVGQASHSVAEQKLVQIEQAIQMFYYDHDRFPGTLDELVHRPADIPSNNWGDPSLRERDLIDPWNNPYQYRYPGQYGTFDLWSYGADGQPGGEGENADITNWD